MHGITKALKIAAGSVLFALALYTLLATPGFLAENERAARQQQAQR